jgi:Ca2+-binding RTX toxin-like protein
MVTGTAGDDELIGTSGDDVIDGLGGNDVLRGGAGSDRLLGGTCDDRLSGDDGDDLLGDDDSGNDLLDGGAGNDRLYLYHVDSGLNETVTLIGGAGNDTISSWSYASGSVTVDAGSGDDEVLLWSPTNSHRLTLGTGRDVLDLNRFQTWLMDTTVREVTDFTPGTLGDTILLFDLLSSYGTWDGQVNPFTHHILQLEQRGSDTVLLIRLDDGTALPHELLILRGVTSGSLVAENFGGFSPNGVAAASMTLAGGSSPDTLAAGYGDDQISGGDGSDTLHGSAGNDRIEGGEGSDYIRGGYGNDAISAGAGADFIELVHDGGSDVVDAGSGNDRISVYRNYRDVFERLTITAGDGDDVVSFQLFDRGRTSVDLGEGNDRFTLIGTAHDLCITLEPGSDTLDLADHYVSTIGQEHVTLLDYTPGEDRILWGNWLKQELVGWDWHSDPFAGGFLRLSEQVGQLVLMVDRDGPAPTIRKRRSSRSGALLPAR